MPQKSPPGFLESGSLEVREVALSASDSLQTYREKIARIILDEMYQFVGLLDPTGRILEINRAALDGAGIELHDIYGKPVWETRWWQVSRETREKIRELVRRAATGEFIRCDLEIYGKSGGEETIFIDFSLMPVRDRHGNIVFLLAEGRNITEKKAVQAEIARKNEELQQLLEQVRRLDQLKSDLFANVSHELRTPLALVLGPAESLIASANNLTDAQRRDLGVIVHNAGTLLKHVNDLLDLAKLDAGKMTMDYVALDVAHLVQTVAAHFDALAPQKSISYAALTPDVLHVEVDPEKLERVLLNLLSNAFKFTPVGGRVQCTVKAENDHFVLAVQDSGPGIPRQMRESIFERFRQLQGGTTREFGGTGLGLTIAKEFVELHGGTIAVSDAPAEGTLVQVEIPIRAPQGAHVRVVNESELNSAGSIAVTHTFEELQAIRPPALVFADVGRPKVMVVEDHPEMRRFICEVLSQEFRVVAVANGLEALSVVGGEKPDLVVSDVMMPELGGDQFIKRLRGQQGLAQLPVLILSAKADDKLRLQLLAESAQDYIVKPFSAAELRARVRNLVAMKRSRDQLQAELATKSEDLASLTNQLILSKRTVEERLVEERKLTSLVENSHDFIGYASREGNAMFVNRAGRTLVGLGAEEVRGTVPVDYVLEEDRPLLRAGMTAALENGNWEGEVRFRNFKTGAVIPMLSHVFLLTDGNSGHEIGLGTISRDVTERKRAEEGLRAVQSELAHVSRVASMGELTASIAHEINQPLTAIVGNANACTRLLNAQSPDLEEIRLAIDDIAKAGNRASEVVSRIRAWVRKTHSERRQLNINDAILDVLPLIRVELDNHQATLHTRLQEGLPPVLGDRIELQQVLINLLLNGMEAMNEVQDRPRALVIESSQRAATVSVLIRDSGIGIGPSTITKIFDTFFTTKSNGLGMGLPICRSIIESHGGRVSATAASPHGTTFQFELPAAA